MNSVMVTFGTRPEAIKMAPLILRLAEDRRFRPIVVVTGQHREMLDQVLRLFDISPDLDLDLQRHGQTVNEITRRVLAGLDPVLTSERPDLVVVQGDTTTTFAGALAAFYHQIPVVHVEAGLRTHDRYAPFPEEINRRLTSVLASLHLAPTPMSAANLLVEGISERAVVCTGNTVIDALHLALARQGPYDDMALDDLDEDPRRVVLVTTHRRESWGAAMTATSRAVARLARDPALRFVVPLHPNPVVQDAFLPAVRGLGNVTVTAPLAYGAFSRLLGRADIIITDSGGIQEEGPSLGKPVLVLRETTERPEAVVAGTVELVGTDEDRIVARTRALLDDPELYRAMSRAVNPYGDGLAAQRSIDSIAWYLGLGDRPVDFDGGARPVS